MGVGGLKQPFKWKTEKSELLTVGSSAPSGWGNTEKNLEARGVTPPLASNVWEGATTHSVATQGTGGGPYRAGLAMTEKRGLHSCWWCQEVGPEDWVHLPLIRWCANQRHFRNIKQNKGASPSSFTPFQLLLLMPLMAESKGSSQHSRWMVCRVPVPASQNRVRKGRWSWASVA